MEFFRANPFIRLLLPFIAGILLQFYRPQNPVFIYFVFGIAALLFLAFSRIWLPYRMHYLKAVLLNLTLLFLGMLLSQKTTQSGFESGSSSESVWFIGELLQIPVEKERVFFAQVGLKGQQVQREWKEEEGTLWVYFEKDSSLAALKAGQTIAFKAPIADKPKQLNPFGFDFSRYLKIKQIDFTVYLKRDDWFVVSDRVEGLRQKALNLRARMVSLYADAGLSGDELAVLSALTLGYKNKLDERVRSAYAGAGASHILAISGMHMAILYGIFLMLFSWMKFFSKKARLKYLLIILLLWTYALITGLSPSVCRASTMFTFLSLGYLLQRRPQVYNSLAASAMLLLLFNPLLLFEIGFQLSYVAVAGIVFFQPKIYRLIYLKNKFLDWAWQLTSVSIAAQLVTSPITLYYFHMFPVYFWLSNIVVIVGATLLLYGAVFLMVFAKVSFITHLLGSGLELVVAGMNRLVEFVNALPAAVITDIPFSTLMVVVLYLFMATFSAWLITRRFRYLRLALLVVLVGVGQRSWHLMEQKKQVYSCVYQLNNASAIQFVSGAKSWWFLSDSLNHKKIAPVVSDANRFWRTRINNYYYLSNFDSTIRDEDFCYHKGFWLMGNTRGYISKGDGPWFEPNNDTLHFDYLFVTAADRFSDKELPAGIAFNQVIVDGSVPPWEKPEWCASKETIPCYFTSEQGAFIRENQVLRMK
ncbi:MAG: ComEC/Rec2 family competence protein [Salinivirgaceae bacterium]